MAYLLSSKEPNTRYQLNTNISCGDSIKRSTWFVFHGTESQIQNLTFIFDKITGLRVTYINETSFKFSSRNRRLLQFCFRISRLTRCSGTNQILLETEKLIRNKVQWWNALQLAMLCQENFSYFNSSRDALRNLGGQETNRIYLKLFSTKAEFIFILNRNISYSNTYYPCNTTEYPIDISKYVFIIGDLRKLYKGSKYKELVNMLSDGNK